MSTPEYIAVFTLSAQVTEDSYKVFQHHLKLKSDTTVAEIVSWRDGFGGCVQISLCLSVLEELKP